MARTCHAIGCTKPCRPNELMDNEHWHMVPLPLRRLSGRPINRARNAPSALPGPIQAAAKAVIAVAEREGRDIPLIWWQMAAGKQEKRA